MFVQLWDTIVKILWQLFNKELNKEQSLKLVFSSFLGEKSEIVFLQRFLDIWHLNLIKTATHYSRHFIAASYLLISVITRDQYLYVFNSKRVSFGLNALWLIRSTLVIQLRNLERNKLPLRKQKKVNKENNVTSALNVLAMQNEIS